MNILNTRVKDTEDIDFLLGIHLECGEFFRHLKKYFEITFYGQVTYTNHTYKNDVEFGIYRDYYCLHIKDINKYLSGKETIADLLEKQYNTKKVYILPKAQ